MSARSWSLPSPTAAPVGAGSPPPRRRRPWGKYPGRAQGSERAPSPFSRPSRAAAPRCGRDVRRNGRPATPLVALSRGERPLPAPPPVAAVARARAPPRGHDGEPGVLAAPATRREARPQRPHRGAHGPARRAGRGPARAGRRRRRRGPLPPGHRHRHLRRGRHGRGPQPQPGRRGRRVAGDARGARGRRPGRDRAGIRGPRRRRLGGAAAGARRARSRSTAWSWTPAASTAPLPRDLEPLLTEGDTLPGLVLAESSVPPEPDGAAPEVAEPTSIVPVPAARAVRGARTSATPRSGSSSRRSPSSGTRSSSAAW